MDSNGEIIKQLEIVLPGKEVQLNLKRYLGWMLIAILLTVSGSVQAGDISAVGLINEVVNQVDKVKDFKGEIRTKVYVDNEKTVDFRTKIMKSETRLMTQNLDSQEIASLKVKRILNTTPWLYLPPDRSTIIQTLPGEGQLNYSRSLKKVDELYEMQLLGEAVSQEREVYIVQLTNKFLTQRLYIDKGWKAISKIEVFNSSNIKAVEINYEGFKEFTSELWLPTRILVKEALGKRILEINYHDWKVNLGLTDFDFARGFQSDYQAQINELKEKLDDDSQKDKIYWHISQIYKENNQLNKAIDNLRNAIRANDNIKYRKELVKLLQNQGRYKAAIGEAKAALRLDYNNSDLYYLLGELNLQSGDMDQARNFLEKAVNIKGDSLKYLEKLFWVYYNLAQGSDGYMLERAEKTAEKMVSLASDDKDYRIYLGDVYFDKGEFLEAAKAYNKAIDLAPEDTWGYIKLAKFYQEVGNFNKAEELYRYVIYLEDSLENRRRLANLYFKYDRYKLALEEYKLIDKRTANDVDVKLKLAETYFAIGDKEQGLNLCKKIIEDNKEGKIYLKTAQMVREYDFKAALEVYYQVLQNEELLTLKQQERLAEGFNDAFYNWEREEREKELEELTYLPIYGDICYFLGICQLQTGEVNEAISNFEDALEFREDVMTHYALGLSYLLIGDFKAATEEVNELIYAGELKKAEQISIVADKLRQIGKKYEDEYVPGRINRLEGDKLRKAGNLKQASIKYKEAAFENYNYELPYLYLAVIYGLRGETFEVELAKTGLQGTELNLLQDFFRVINEISS